MGLYRVALAGNPEYDFTVGTEHRTYGLVKEIKETTDVLSYDGDSYASSYGTIVKVIFEDQEIIFRFNNPYLILYYDTNSTLKSTVISRTSPLSTSSPSLIPNTFGT